jgi:hypothetical protein
MQPTALSASPLNLNLAENNSAPGIKPAPTLPEMTLNSKIIVQSTIGYNILNMIAPNNAAAILHTMSSPLILLLSVLL